MSGGGQSQEGPVAYGPCWPAWSRADGYARLAGYVAPLAAKGLGLTVTVEEGPGVSAAESELLRGERLYELLRERGIGYGWEPRVPRKSVQQVRDPRWLIEDRLGTCLDIATTYATICMEAHVDVLLAVTDGHAFVVLTPGRLDENPDPTAKFELDGFEEVEFGVAEGNMSALARAADAGRVVPVEATWVTDSPGFGQASKFGPGANGSWDGEERVLLIDVPLLHATGAVAPLAPPEGRPTIRRYVPSGRGGFKHYEGDESLIERLRTAKGSNVLLAQPGQGKSMIARHLAEEAPFGAAWFLDASEPQALINSLAAARLAEENRGDETPDAAARVALAHAALAQLREAEGAWLVVLDNADGDPTKLRKWIPRPAEGQHVLVTTTNCDWASMPDFEVHALPDVADAELERLGIGALSPLVGGRRLLLEAFARLQEANQGAGPDIAGCAAAIEAEVEDEELRGPAVFWAALSDSAGFGERELRTSAFAAHLPPDRQPVSLLEQLLGADEALPFLEGRGLIAWDEDLRSIRLHRLFGAAIRRDLDARCPDLRDEVAHRLTTVKEALLTLDRYGDLATVGRLDDRLGAIDAEAVEPDERLGVAMHGAARLLERHAQTRRSGESFARAERHLADRPTLIADCLHGRARTVNQHHAREEGMLRQAVGWARSARQLLLDAEGEDANADRCLAMEGLLTKALARYPASGETRVDVLRRALALLEDADERRSRRADISEEESARSLFNLAGIRVDLAQGEPERAGEHLDKAGEVYGKVGAWRRRLYGCDVHPHIAACEIGLAYVDYYRATLVPTSRRQRSLWLRNSTDYAVVALKQWETLEGSVDVEEAPKCARFLTKVALARHVSPAAFASAPRNVFNEAMRELTDAGIVFEPVPPLPAGVDGLVPAIDGWARSVALAELVGEFGEEVPREGDLGSLLDWLEAFSERWDYRAGKERNLVTAPQLEAATEKVVLAGAASLGLIKGGAVPAGEYHHVLILGGLARACLARPLHAAKLVGEGAIQAASITALGGYRELKGDELGLVDGITGEEVADEFDAMDSGVRHAFGLGTPSAERGEQSEVVGESWRVREYVAEGGMPVRVAAAPSSEPGTRRANTPDTIEWFAVELAHLQPGERVLAITSDIYVPYQHADALRMMALPHGIEVETAGIQPGDLDPRLSQVFRPHAYLQEVRSTILALNRLLAALPGE